MPEIVFLLGDVGEARNDNHLRLPQGFRDAGWRVTELPHDCLRIHRGALYLGTHDPYQFDLIWPLGFGAKSNFFDRIQLLRTLDQRRLVNSADTLVYLHGKYRWLELMPETHASNDAAALARIVAGGGDWVAKPPAGSYGNGVERLGAGVDPLPVLESLTGPASSRYCIVQRYVPEISAGEVRTIVAGGGIIGSYLRIPQDDLRANLSAGGKAVPGELNAPELAIVRRVAGDLQDMGCRFAAVDTAHGYLMEVNVANPGGLATLESLYGKDPVPAVIAAIVAG